MSVAFGSSFTVRDYTWIAWKVVQSAKRLLTQYEDDGLQYTIYGYDGPEVHLCKIWKGTVPYSVTNYTQEQNDLDKADFEADYMPTANRMIQPTTREGMPIMQALSSTVGMPPDGTTIKRTVMDEVSGTSDDVYTVTNNKTLTIRRLMAGMDDSPGRIELHARDTSGTALSLSTLLYVLYLNGDNASVDLDETVVGNGARQVVLRRIHMAGGKAHMFARWHGYER